MMHDVRALTVCVGYDDFLQLTLPRTIESVASLTVITSPADTLTQALCQKYPDKVRMHITDVFYKNGASFNKGAAIEETFGIMGRRGWFLVMDADILLPETMPDFARVPGRLYTPLRRIMSKVDGLMTTPDVDPATLPLRKEHGHFGYFQLFSAADAAVGELPWYETDWVHAGGCDSVFEKRWLPRNKLRPPFEVIHLGNPDENWYGRTRKRIDTGEVPPDAAVKLLQQEALHRKYGWKGRPKTGEPAVERIGNDPALRELCHNHGKQSVPSIPKNRPITPLRHIPRR